MSLGVEHGDDEEDMAEEEKKTGATAAVEVLKEDRVTVTNERSESCKRRPWRENCGESKADGSILPEEVRKKMICFVISHGSHSPDHHHRRVRGWAACGSGRTCLVSVGSGPSGSGSLFSPAIPLT